MANYKQKRTRAHKLIRKHGAAIQVERDGRTIRGFAIADGDSEANRDTHLDVEKRTTYLSTIELIKGDIILFTKSKERKQIDTVTPLRPDGDIIIYYECEAVV